MLTRMEAARRAADLGVPVEQVRRDELISHLIVEVAKLDGVVFFGGTALCRTHLPGWRRSEDIDLLCDDAAAARARLSEIVPLALRRHYPGTVVEWHRMESTSVGRVAHDDLTVRVQLVATDASYRGYATEMRAVDLRYPSLPETVDLRVPTHVSAAAMKLNAWAERQAPRDLADLWRLHTVGLLGRDAVELARQVSSALQPHVFDTDRTPTRASWQSALGAQMGSPPDPALAFHEVRSVVADLADWEIPDWRHQFLVNRGEVVDLGDIDLGT